MYRADLAVHLPEHVVHMRVDLGSAGARVFGGIFDAHVGNIGAVYIKRSARRGAYVACQYNAHTAASISPFLQGKSTPLYLPERRLSSPPAAAQISPINAYVTTALMSSTVPVSISCITAGHTGSAHIAR